MRDSAEEAVQRPEGRARTLLHRGSPTLSLLPQQGPSQESQQNRASGLASGPAHQAAF